MKRLSLIFFILLLSACGADTDQFVLIEGQEAKEIESFLHSYKETMIDAVNSGDFNELETYLITNNSFYHSLRRYVNDMHSDHTTKELDAFIVEKVFVDELGEYHADVNENVTMFEFGQKKKIERSVRFEVVRGGDDSLRVVTIRDRK
ncbi:TcaA NTF2-like domain-containing protein [Halalkalibacter alkalisediminis]|uniref:TcaA protein NTF2-like domain-containing protein n=1 Tax=Halalkalibacter alkalisediminis TaxID=935616 RepID=A0ABV6ND90_9BACI|nr:hypothetical protein [Halalkalibacter alkalisediminis]